MMQNIQFIEVTGSSRQVEILYGLLEQRRFGISHSSMPTLESHVEFVANHPYLIWCIILADDRPLGSFYVQDDNSVGINLLNPDTLIVEEIFAFLNSEFKPRTRISSKVPPYFFINVSIDDDKMNKILTRLGLKSLQISYKIE